MDRSSAVRIHLGALFAICLCVPVHPQPPAPTEKSYNPLVRVTTDWMGRTLMVVGDERRAIPIWIADLEADRIRLALAGQPAPRPLTHDLLLNVLTELGWRVSEAQVSRFDEGVFFGTLVLTNGEERKEIDARASDAIALAVRAKARVVVAESVYEAVGARDAEARSVSLDEAIRQVQQAPTDLAAQVLTWAIGRDLPTLEITPKEPVFRVWVHNDNTVATYGALESDLRDQLVRQLKERAGLDLEAADSPQTANLPDYSHPTKRKLKLTLSIEPAPTGESVRVDIQPTGE